MFPGVLAFPKHFNNHSSGKQTPGDRSAAYCGGCTRIYLSELEIFHDSMHLRHSSQTWILEGNQRNLMDSDRFRTLGSSGRVSKSATFLKIFFLCIVRGNKHSGTVPQRTVGSDRGVPVWIRDFSGSSPYCDTPPRPGFWREIDEI